MKKLAVIFFIIFSSMTFAEKDTYSFFEGFFSGKPKTEQNKKEEKKESTAPSLIPIIEGEIVPEYLEFQ